MSKYQGSGRIRYIIWYTTKYFIVSSQYNQNLILCVGKFLSNYFNYLTIINLYLFKFKKFVYLKLTKRNNNNNFSWFDGIDY